MSSRAKRGDLKEIASSKASDASPRNDKGSDLRQSPLWAEYMKKIGWEATRLDGNFIFSKPLLGRRIVKIPRFSEKLNLKELDKWLKTNKALLTKLEPDLYFPTTNGSTPLTILSLSKDYQLPTNNFSPDNWSLAPTKTIVIDLSKSADDLLKNMEKDTRYNVRLAEKRGVKVSVNKDLTDFLPLYEETGKRGHFWISLDELKTRWEIFCKEAKAQIFTAYLDKQPLASAMVFYHQNSAYYLHAGSGSKNRDLMAPYLLIWEIIKETKKQGYIYFDLEGITDPRIPDTKNWKGFSLFKKGFGGQEITSLGPLVRIDNLFLKIVFKIGNFFSR